MAEENKVFPHGSNADTVAKLMEAPSYLVVIEMGHVVLVGVTVVERIARES